jgi:hypothetical protein
MEYAAVFRKIASFVCTCCDSYGRGLPIGGMIYVQRITDMRMSGSSLKSLRIFEKICGERQYKDVVVVTTMWSFLKTNEARDAAMMRQKTMGERLEFFGNLIKGGASIKAHRDDNQSGLSIVELILDRQRTVVLQLQHEMKGGATMKLEGTTAGKYVEGELANTRDRYETQKRDLEECIEEACDDEDLKNEFTEQVQDRARLVDNIKVEQESLSVTLEDIRNEQEARFSMGRHDLTEDVLLEVKSTRLFELEDTVQRQEKMIMKGQAQLRDVQDRNKKLEATRKEQEETRDREQTTREDRTKEKRTPQGEYALWMRNFLIGRDLRDSGQPLRRAESMPMETKAAKKASTKSRKTRSRSKGRQGSKPNTKRTSSDEQARHALASSQYLQEHLNHEPGFLDVSESDYESENEDSAAPVHAPHHTHSYTPATPSTPNSHFHVPHHDVSFDPTGTMRVPPPPPQNPLRRIPYPVSSPYHQHPLRSASYSSTSPGEPNYRR